MQLDSQSAYWVVDTFDRDNQLISRSQPFSRDMANIAAMSESHREGVARAEIVRITEERERVLVHGAIVPLKTIDRILSERLLAAAENQWQSASLNDTLHADRK